MQKIKILSILAAAFLCTGLAPLTAQAQELPPVADNVSEYELSPDDDTHPMIRLTPDKSEIVRLDSDAASIIVGNPSHLNVLLDSARTLVLVPRDPGATRFTVLDKSGRVIMQRHAIIASPKQDYVRVRRTCATGQSDCQPVSVFYCPDMCHAVNIMDSSQGAPQIDSSNSGASSLSALPDEEPAPAAAAPAQPEPATAPATDNPDAPQEETPEPEGQ